MVYWININPCELIKSILGIEIHIEEVFKEENYSYRVKTLLLSIKLLMTLERYSVDPNLLLMGTSGANHWLID